MVENNHGKPPEKGQNDLPHLNYGLESVLEELLDLASCVVVAIHCNLISFVVVDGDDSLAFWSLCDLDESFLELL